LLFYAYLYMYKKFAVATTTATVAHHFLKKNDGLRPLVLPSFFRERCPDQQTSTFN
jgi:hypothetical protein